MSYCKKDGKDIVIFVTPNEQQSLKEKVFKNINKTKNQKPKTKNKKQKTKNQKQKTKNKKPKTKNKKQKTKNRKQKRYYTSAIDAITKDLNWDCPCVASEMRKPCAEDFRKAIYCWNTSKDITKCSSEVNLYINCTEKYPQLYQSKKDKSDSPTPTPAPAPAPQGLISFLFSSFVSLFLLCFFFLCFFVSF